MPSSHKKRVHRRHKLKQTVHHRGKKRRVIVEINHEDGTINIRLAGCKLRRRYHAADLWLVGIPQMALPL